MSGHGRDWEPDTFEVGAGTLGFVAALFLLAVALYPTVQTHAVFSLTPFAAPAFALFVAFVYRKVTE